MEKNSDGSVEVKIVSLAVMGPRKATWLPAQARRDRWVSTALTHVGNTLDVAKSGCLAAGADVPEPSSALLPGFSQLLKADVCCSVPHLGLFSSSLSSPSSRPGS